MFDAALAHFGFMPTAKKVTTYNNVKWAISGHDLDRVYTRDGVAYGCEIKNKLDYIDAEELTAKIEMCRHLGLKPLFIMRGSPKSYNHDINLAGGFALIYRYQLYPHGQGDGGPRLAALFSKGYPAAHVNYFRIHVSIVQRTGTLPRP